MWHAVVYNANYACIHLVWPDVFIQCSLRICVHPLASLNSGIIHVTVAGSAIPELTLDIQGIMQCYDKHANQKLVHGIMQWYIRHRK